MTATSGSAASHAPLSDDEFEAFRRWIYREAGISLSSAKRALVTSRVAKRLRRLGLETYGAYYEYVEAHPGEERQELINCLTTNKTEFFREPHHFRLLRERVFPEIEARAAQRGRTVRLWSAACSTGEEPYTLAITALEHFGSNRGWDVRILASDIDTDVLAAAEAGVYPAAALTAMEAEIAGKYFCEPPGGSEICRVRPEVRNLVTFRRINFMEDAWPIRSTFDAIFCRNVLIYFDRETQDRVVGRLAERLSPNGYLMLGHSEGVAGLASRLAPLGGTAYQRKAAPNRESEWTQPATPAPSSPTNSVARANENVIVGDVFATDEVIEIRTVLGSCVAACVFDPDAKVGGMNHVLLPGGEPSGLTRFAVPAVDELVRRVVRLGGHPRRLRAKLFGGAVRRGAAGLQDVGGRNAESVKRRLAELGIPIAAERLGGEQAVRVRFFPDTGRVLVEPLLPKDVSHVLSSEAEQIRRSARPAAASEVAPA